MLLDIQHQADSSPVATGTEGFIVPITLDRTLALQRLKALGAQDEDLSAATGLPLWLISQLVFLPPLASLGTSGRDRE